MPADHRSGFVAVLGKPNVGKSTLMNAFVGQKIAIVSDKPQTTRRRILGILTIPQAQIIFVDTPGIHKPRHRLGEYMVETAVRTVPDSDLILFLVDVSQPPTRADEWIARLLREQAQAPVVLVLNKVDLLAPEDVEPHYQAYSQLVEHADGIMISATRGDNRDKLLEMVIDQLPIGPQYYPADQVTDQPERVIAAELVREQALRFTYQEVPHSLEVVVEEFKERKEDLFYIKAIIFVERDSQKGIVIGAKGAMLKKIGQAARQELERFVGRRVYLDLWVKVRPKWRRDEKELRRLGYVLPKAS
ncbi:MAG: GTPase Era [Anaerolineae bacterium]